MKKTTYLLVFGFLLMGSIQLLAQDQKNAEASLTGQWTLSAVYAFTDPSNIPQYQVGDYIWDFGDGRGYQMTISANDGVEQDDFALAPGNYSVWNRRCLLKIGDRTFKYKFQSPAGSTENNNMKNPSGEMPKLQLILQTSLDPRIADGGYTLVLSRI